MKHLERALEGLKRDVLKMSGLVDEQVDAAIQALLRRDVARAERVIQRDDILDEWDVHVEEEGLKILALHQPVAQDLRFVVTVIKINGELERMGDYAVNIAERSLVLSAQPPLPAVKDFDRMADRVKEMIRSCSQALVERDGALARRVIAMDELVDGVFRDMFQVFEGLMRDDPTHVPSAVQMLSVSRYLERMGDHAKNIAEDVVYLIEGEIIRHRRRLPALANGRPGA